MEGNNRSSGTGSLAISGQPKCSTFGIARTSATCTPSTQPGLSTPPGTGKPKDRVGADICKKTAQHNQRASPGGLSELPTHLLNVPNGLHRKTGSRVVEKVRKDVCKEFLAGKRKGLPPNRSALQQSSGQSQALKCFSSMENGWTGKIPSYGLDLATGKHDKDGSETTHVEVKYSPSCVSGSINGFLQSPSGLPHQMKLVACSKDRTALTDTIAELKMHSLQDSTDSEDVNVALVMTQTQQMSSLNTGTSASKLPSKSMPIILQEGKGNKHDSATVTESIAVLKSSVMGVRKGTSQKPWSASTKPSAKSFQAEDSSRGKVKKLPEKSTGQVLPSPKLETALRKSPALPENMGGTPEKLFHLPKKVASLPESLGGQPEQMKELVAVQDGIPARRTKHLPEPSHEKISDSRAMNLSVLQKEILKKVAGSPVARWAKLSRRNTAAGASPGIDLSVAGRRARRLSQVLRSEKDMMQQNRQYAQELQQLQHDFNNKEHEFEGVMSAGMLLKQLCAHQSEELKALKVAFPAVFKEMSELRKLCSEQEKELQMVQTSMAPLQAELTTLRARIQSLMGDLKQARAEKYAIAERLEHSERAAFEARCHVYCVSKTHKPLLKTQSPSSGSTSSCLPTKYTPPKPRESKHGHNGSPSQGRSVPDRQMAFLKGNPVREVQPKALHRKENKHQEMGELLQQLRVTTEQEESVLQERCTNALQDLASFPSIDNKSGAAVHSVTSKRTNILQIASRGLENQC